MTDSLKQNNTLGVSATIAGVIMFSFMDIIVAYLGRNEYPISQIMFYRSVIAIPLTFAYLRYDKSVAKLNTALPYLHLARCVCGSLAMFMVFYAFSKLDVATVTSLWSSAPIIVTILSFFFLKEQIGIHRWSAVIVGFIGVLIIRPPQSFEWLIALPLCAAVLTAIVVILLRILGKTEPAAVTSFYFACTSTVVALLLSIGTTWKTPDAFGWLLLVGTAIFATIGQLLATQSFRWAEASLIMPIRYIGIVFVTLLAFIFFHEVPTWQTIIGASFIIAAGIYTVYREIYRKRQAKHAN